MVKPKDGSKITNFRLSTQELANLKILSFVLGMPQAEVIRYLIRAEVERQSEAIEAYKKSVKEIRKKKKK